MNDETKEKDFRILVVDDEEKIRRSLSGLLQDHGYEVATVANGMECLKVMSSRHFDLVLMDMVMPDMNGIETLRTIKERHAESEVIMISAYADKEKAIAALRLDAYDLIEKPFESKEVLNTISRCLEQMEMKGEIERKSRELKESEERYRNLYENAYDMIQSVTPDGRFVFVNPAWIRAMGYSWEDLKGMTVFDILHPDSRPHCAEVFQKVMSGERVDRIEAKFVSQDGRVIDVEGTIGVRRGKEGVLASYGIFRDITERKKAADSLLDSEQRLRAIVDNAAAVIFLKDTHGRYLLVNRRYEELFHVKSAEIQSKTDYDIFPRDMAEAFCENDQVVVRTGKPIEVEEHVPHDDGIHIYVSVKFPIRRITGEIYAVCGIATDITELKKTNELLLQAKQDWEDTFNTITDMITIHDKDFSIIHANKAAEKMLGLPLLETISGAKCFSYYHGTERPPEGCPSCPALRTGKPVAFEMFEPHLKMFVEIRAIPRFDSDGRIIGLIHVVRDITDRKKLEAQLLQSQKMEAIGTLAGGVAHDFNNILTGIIGYGQIAIDKMADNDPQRQNIKQMLEAADRAAHLTKDLLLFSRKQVPERRPLDLNDVIRKVEKFLARVIGEDIECRTALSARQLTVLADAHQVEQVLLNMAANARDAMAKGGAFTITTEQVRLDEKFIAAHGYGKPGNYVLTTISDTGKGMDEVTRQHIFEPFFTTKEVGKGTGLGMAVAYGIIKQHDGFISVYSEPSQGTTFKLYLPLITSAVDEEKQIVEERPLGGTETILLAEDDETVRNLSRAVLEDIGYTVITAKDGQDAVTKYKENKDKIQLLLFDVIMPKKNGKDAFEEIKGIRHDIRAIFISGHAGDIIQRFGIEEGMEFISKPALPNELLRMVRKVLDKSKKVNSE